MGIDRKRKAKGKSDYATLGRFFALPLDILHHENWTRLSPHGCKLVVDLGKQFDGKNNGYLSCAWEVMQKQGWKSRETLTIATAEAQHYGLIERTRQGGMNRPSLYALTWWKINSRQDDPLDCSSTLRPSGTWKEKRAKFETPDWVKAKRERDRDRERAKRSISAVVSERASLAAK